MDSQKENPLVLFGLERSVYTRIARLAFEEKGVPCTLEEVEIFGADGYALLQTHPELLRWYDAMLSRGSVSRTMTPFEVLGPWAAGDSYGPLTPEGERLAASRPFRFFATEFSH